MSQTKGNARPPARSISSAAVKIVPGSFGWGAFVLAAIATFAPSFAARSAIARPIPRLAPLMKSVLPFKEVTGAKLPECARAGKWRPSRRSGTPIEALQAFALISLLVAQDATLEEQLLKDRGWASGTLQDQLDRDPTLIPFGKGALFVPAFNNPLDEPPITVFSGGQVMAEGTTGQRIVLLPGTYEVRLGSGAEEQRLKVQATVKEQHTTIVPVSWSGLSVHMVDEQYSSLRGSYELIRVDDREYIGIGFGTDEQAGEPVSTWILKPGVYKIVRVGENYRARRDFATVRLVPGELTHFLLVLNGETGDFVGGGEIPEEEVFRPRNGFFGSVILGGDASMNSRSNAPGTPDGISLSVRAFADARLSFEIAENPLLLRLQIEEGQSKAPDLPWAKSNDRADLDALYVYRVTNFLGPYARFGAETNFLPGYVQFTEPTDARVVHSDGTVEELHQVDKVKLSPPFGLTRLKEGAGIHIRLLKTTFAETTLRTGIGARHSISRELFNAKTNTATTTLEYEQAPTTDQVGVEATALASARITRWVLINLEADSLFPFNGLDKLVLELEGSVIIKLTSYASINYRVRFTRNPLLTDKDVIEQDVLLRLSLEIL